MQTAPAQNAMNTSALLRFRFLSLLTVAAVWCDSSSIARADAVRISEQELAIPTYLAGDPEPNPMFFFGQGSQGAEGRVYPYPLYDTLTNIKSNKLYRIVYLENEYVRIGILPEVGGRLFEAVDKSNGYNFIYRQHVIKPALIGLIGAWISGGIEWNIPHHHRATTFLPVQYRLASNADGSKTVWVGELEVRHRMRWAVGYTLRPGKSYLECSVRIVNRTPVVNTMLCFANVAVHVNQDYQVIYPPGTRFVTFHGKREFTTWPLATTRYAGADFTRGVDVSWYTNHIEANSMFAWNYEDDFFAGYDHGKQAGIMSFADHHDIPGKKFWTWGNGPRGRMWDKILTDEDGPYIELMVGAYSDNQPDYSWLQPYETKAFEMYWYPFRDIGGVKKANLEAAVNLEVKTNGSARVGFCTTSAHRAARMLLQAGAKVLLDETAPISPARAFVKTVTVPAGLDEHDLRASISVEGRELVAYSPVRLEPAEMPKPVQSPPLPKDIKTIEELYLAGLRIEQFHSPGQDPEPYWEEALRRDPGDARANTALGIRLFKQARFAEAEQHFRCAIARLTLNYTSPKDGEPFYYLGLTLQARSWEPGAENPGAAAKAEEDSLLKNASDAFAKAAWSQAWRAPAYYGLAEIASRKGETTAALSYVDRALEANALNLRALTLKASLLRDLGQRREALALLAAAGQKTDPLDARLMAERWLAGDKQAVAELIRTEQRHPATALETAAEYFDAGRWRDGSALIGELERACPPGDSHCKLSPLAYYYAAEFSERLGDAMQAAEYRRRGRVNPPDTVFPFQWELVPVLCRAMAADPHDARAPYYLGDLLFDSQPEEGLKLWQRSVAQDPAFPLAHRNLALAYGHRKSGKDMQGAIAELELAVAGPQKYARHFTELDELYAAQGVPPEKRLALFEQNDRVVVRRDDALSREIGLKVFCGKYDEAIQLMTGRKFSVWEGGELAVADHWLDAHLLRGRQRLQAGETVAALADFEAAKAIPENLPTERELGRDAELAWWLGVGNEAAGNPAKAKESWEQAAKAQAKGRGRREGSTSPLSAQIFYQASANRKLGNSGAAEDALKKLLEAAKADLAKEETTDQNVQTERRPRRAGPGFSHYLAGLAHLGLGENEAAKEQFIAALAASPDLLGAKVASNELR
jgi:tetratricopeptide (TPR) repeat protein